ncbi:MAG: hypothetical protein AAGC56_12695, partial [Pseudomonadota bacterium]
RPQRRPAPARSDGPGPQATGGVAGRVGVRLDPRERRLLRIAAAALGRPQQTLLRAAVHRYFSELARTELQACVCFRRRLAEPRETTGARGVPPTD